MVAHAQRSGGARITYGLSCGSAGLVLLLAVVPLTSCARSFAPVPVTAPTEASPSAAAVRSGSTCPPTGLGIVRTGGVKPGIAPPGFVGIRVVQCLSDSGTSGNDHQLHFSIVEKRGPYSEYMKSALHSPNPPLPSVGGCTLDWTPVVYVLIVDGSNRSYRAYVPHDYCGRPTNTVVEALDELVPVRTYDVTTPCDRRC